MKKRTLILAACILAVSVLCGKSFAVSLINGFSNDGDFTVSTGTVNKIIKSSKIYASKYLINTGEGVSIMFSESIVRNSYVASAFVHNKTARYDYDGVYKYQLDINGETYTSEKINKSFSKEGDYQIQGYVTYRWKTSMGKVAAGFPKYYYITVKTNIIVVRVSDIDNAAEPEQPKDGSGAKSKPEPELHGHVGHTEEWENNRKAYNEYAKNVGNSELMRNDNVFWSGEKFILTADVRGTKLPLELNVSIKRTHYKTSLLSNGEEYSGSLFDESMINLWGQDGPEELIFLFSGEIDGKHCEDVVKVVVDDSVKYWLLHRKE